ncbi:hypothetical protein HYT54_01730 [Candidatus Woesearchaeota archaeon]|nr:hypothetical protein [Candidatus Woesearchaeota archaeon]
MSRIIPIAAVPLALLIALKYFKIYDVSPIIPYDLAMLGALFLIATQLITYIVMHHVNRGTSFMGKLIKLTLAFPGILYFINLKFPLNLGFDLEIVIAMFLLTEGIYALH